MNFWAKIAASKVLAPVLDVVCIEAQMELLLLYESVCRNGYIFSETADMFLYGSV